MDEIFGEEKFLGRIAWESKTKSQNTKDAYRKLQPKVETIFVYAKNEKPKFNLFKTGKKEYPEKDERGFFRYALIEQMNSSGTRGRKSMVFKIQGILPKKGRQWKLGEETIKNYEKRDDIVIIKNKPHIKMRPEDERSTITEPFWGFFSQKIGTTESAKKEVSAIIPDHGFETAKPVALIYQLIFHSSSKNDLILDSFAGSGTTAQAVLELNKEGRGNRKFILVECEDYADKITAERVRRVIKGVNTASDKKLKIGLGGSFTYCTLGEEISKENLLRGESLPSYETLSKYVFYTATGKTIEKITENEDYYITKSSDDMAFFVIYKPDKQFLRSNDSALSLDRKKKIQKIMKQKKCSKAIVFASNCFHQDKELSQENITFCKLPFAIHRIVGS